MRNINKDCINHVIEDTDEDLLECLHCGKTVGRPETFKDYIIPSLFSIFIFIFVLTLIMFLY